MFLARFKILSLFGLTFCFPLEAAVVVDSFTEDSFELDSENSVVETSVDLAFANRRSSRINPEFGQPSTSMSSTLDTGSGNLSFSVDGTSNISSRPLDLRMSYSQGGPYDISGFSAYEFDFTSLSGSGFLIVELASSSSNYERLTTRIDLNSAGTLTVPFDSVNFGAGGSLDSFPATHFVFEAETEQFSFVLDEVRVVPEPSPMLLLGLGVSGLFIRRRVT